MSNVMTATEYLQAHSITAQLKRLDVTQEQLEGLRFSRSNQGWPFDQWSFRWLDGTPAKAIPFFKAYCALKWLLLENPPASRDKEDAWRLVSEVEAAPVFEIGIRTKAMQQLRAKKPRGKIPDAGTTLNQRIKELALRPEHCEESAKELWPHFSSELEELGLEPVEKAHPKGSLQKCAYEYGPKDRRKQITYGRFANVISEARTKNKSR